MGSHEQEIWPDRHHEPSSEQMSAIPGFEISDALSPNEEFLPRINAVDR